MGAHLLFRHAIGCLILLATPAFADDMTPGSAACDAALAQIEISQDESSATLDATSAGDNAAYCAALLHDAETIEAAVKIYGACLPEAEGKAEGLAGLAKNAVDLRDMMIGEECPEP